MFRKILNISLLLFFFTTSLFAEIINSISIKGNVRISDETIVVFSKVKTGQNLSENNLNEIIIDLFNTNFFKDVSLNLDKNILTITVEENPIIQTLNINGVKNKNLLKDLEETIILTDRSSYKELFAKRDVNIILNKLRLSGYYFAKVDYVVDFNDNNTLDLTYDVKLGKKAVIKKIKFLGDKLYKDRKLKSIITSEEDKFWKFISNKKFIDPQRIDLDRRILRDFYLNKGFYKVDVKESYADMIDRLGFELIFNINVGKKYFFNDLNVKLPEDYNIENFSKLNLLFQKLKDKTYSAREVDSILKEIDKIALNDQFEFITTSVKEEIVDNNRLNFTFEIKETEKRYIERINIFGNTITREEVIRNILLSDEGDPYNELLLKKTVNNLKAQNLFASVDSEVVEGSESHFSTVNLTVEEKPTGEISLGAGYGTRGAAISFTIKENNFLGKGVKLVTDISYSADSLSGSFSHTTPNFRYSDKSLTSRFASRRTDKIKDYGYKTTTNTLGISTYFEQYQDLYISPAIAFKHEDLKTTSTASSQFQKQKGTFYDITIPYSIRYDKRDSAYQTREGFYSNFKQEIPLVSNHPSLVNTYEYKKYFSMSEDFLNTIGFYAKAVNSISNKDVRISKRVNLPSDNLRGFEYGKIGPRDGGNYVGGNYAASVNMATHLPNILPALQNVDFSLFLDAANVWGVDYNSSLDNSSGTIRSAFGVAVDWFTPIGPLNFSFSQPVTSASTDIKETFRFNLGTTF